MNTKKYSFLVSLLLAFTASVYAQTITTIAGGTINDGGPATNAYLYAPGSIVTDIGGNIYFSDMNNGRIRKINASGTISTIAGGGIFYPYDGASATDVAIQPSAITIDGDGNIYFVEGSRIYKLY